ncbi:hypothetical protein BGZ65_004744, partial [Modicella reniformis]
MVITKSLVQEVDDVLQGSDPTYETHKKQRIAEAWYDYLPEIVHSTRLPATSGWAFMKHFEYFLPIPRNLEDDVPPD